jgi:hypothetical protein
MGLLCAVPSRFDQCETARSFERQLASEGVSSILLDRLLETPAHSSRHWQARAFPPLFPVDNAYLQHFHQWFVDKTLCSSSSNTGSSSSSTEPNTTQTNFCRCHALHFVLKAEMMPHIVFSSTLCWSLRDIESVDTRRTAAQLKCVEVYCTSTADADCVVVYCLVLQCLATR